MKRRDFITLLSSAAAWPVAARAQQPGRVWRIGVLETVSQALNTTNMDAFQQGLRALGYVEGQNYALEYRSSDGDDDRFLDLATELVRLNVDLIVTRGTPAALAAKKSHQHCSSRNGGKRRSAKLWPYREPRATWRKYYGTECTHVSVFETNRAVKGVGSNSCPSFGPPKHEQPRSCASVERD